MKKIDILQTQVNALSQQNLVDLVHNWTKKNESKYICFANVHMIMEGYDDENFRNIVNKADIVAPDGMPLVWYIKLAGFKNQERVCGPDMTLKICELAEKESIPIGFFGSSEEVLKKLKTNLIKMYPKLKISCCISPPFRKLTIEESKMYINQINNSGIKILFVGLGCPKQEKWMFQHRNEINSVMLGVGAAFDFISGTKKIAPDFLKKCGLEWLYRLLQEPKRLWKRYLKHNPRFVFLAFLEITKNKLLNRKY